MAPEDVRVRRGTQQAWTLGAVVPEASTGVAVLLTRTRTSVITSHLSMDGRDFELKRKGRVLMGAFPEPVDRQGLSSTLVIRYLGQAPRIAEVHWLPDALDAGVDLEAVAAPRLAEEDWIANLLARSTEFDREYHATRREGLENEMQIRAFFGELDLVTDSWLMDSEASDRADRVRLYLEDRVRERAYYARTSGGSANTRTMEVPLFPVLEDEHPVRGSLKAISATMIDLVNQYLLADGGDLVGWAFEQFAVDRAGSFHEPPDRHTNHERDGVPDSTEFFKFAELAFACRDNSVDAEFWEKYLPVLVRAAHLFAENAGEPTAGNEPGCGPASYRFRPGRYYPTERRTLHRAWYDALLQGSVGDKRVAKLEDCFGCILGQVFDCTESWFPDARPRRMVHEVRVFSRSKWRFGPAGK